MLIFLFAVMSKKIILKKIAQMVEGSKGASLVAKSTSTVKGITLGEKCPRDKMPDITPTKKGKSAFDTKNKGTISPSGAKKKAMWKFKTPPSKATSTLASVVATVEGTSTNPKAFLGALASMLENPTVVEKLLERVIPLVDKEEVEKMDLDWAISWLFCVVGEVTPCL